MTKSIGPDLVHQETGEVYSLPMIDGARECRVSLTLPQGLPFDEWQRIGVALSHMECGVQWWLGDWWAFGSHSYGARAAAVARGLFGRSFQTLANCASISRSFETSRRREVLSWSHHAEVASLPQVNQDELLNRAEREEWSRQELRAAVQRSKNRVGADPETGETCTTDDLRALIEIGSKFATIYADPPWQYGNQGTRAATGRHYGGMTVDEIAALPIAELVADDAHLHLWTTNAFLFDCRRIIEAWGFEYKSCFVWVKPSMGIGNYWRVSHEFMLFGVRGKAPFRDHSRMSWGQFDRGSHSAKPAEVRDTIEAVSPGPRLELFGRTCYAPGWTIWGNEIERNLFNAMAKDVA